MQHHPRRAVVRAVRRVPDDRQAEGDAVEAELVAPSRRRLEEELGHGFAHVRTAREFKDGRRGGPRVLPLPPALVPVRLRRVLVQEGPHGVHVPDHHFKGVLGRLADRFRAGQFPGRRRAPDEREVLLLDPALLETDLRGRGGLLRRRVEHDAARRVVELVAVAQLRPYRGRERRPHQVLEVRVAVVVFLFVDAHVVGLVDGDV